MIGQDQLSQKPSMTGDDKKKLFAILSEMKSRGMEIPKNIKLPSDTVSDDWGQDENGYFVKKDGTKFNPRQELVDFINDKSVYPFEVWTWWGQSYLDSYSNSYL